MLRFTFFKWLLSLAHRSGNTNSSCPFSLAQGEVRGEEEVSSHLPCLHLSATHTPICWNWPHAFPAGPGLVRVGLGGACPQFPNHPVVERMRELGRSLLLCFWDDGTMNTILGIYVDPLATSPNPPPTQQTFCSNSWFLFLVGLKLSLLEIWSPWLFLEKE